MTEQNIIIERNIDEVLEENYMPYAIMSIIDRALPSVYDAFKPSHRKLLYTMYKMGLLKSKVKCANITGQTLRLNPHSDSSVYETLVRMVDTNESLLVPYVKGKGSFGKVYSDGAYAHQRYTEAGLTEIANELFKNIDKNSVDFVDNYDNTMKEPVLLPVTFPNILCNSTQGIAVGMASNICSFNIKDVCNATIDYLKNDSTDNIKLIPDFSTYGYYLYDENELMKINTTGKGSIKLRSNYYYDKANNCIEITQIPYTTKVEQIIDKICDLIKLKKITEIVDVRDETDLKGLKLTIDIKRNVDIDSLMAKLYKMTTLEDTFSCNFNVLYEDENNQIKPKVMGTREIIEVWSKWRINCIKRELQHNIDEFSKELHKLKGLEKITFDINKAIELIRFSKTDELVLINLMEYFKIDKIQAEYVSNIRLRNLNEDYINKQIETIKELEHKLEKLHETINDVQKVKSIICIQLENVIKKYGQDRRTSISYEAPVSTKDIMIDDYSCTYVVSKQGYLKKNIRYTENQNFKDGDSLLMAVVGNNKSDVILITDRANAYTVKGHTIDECKPSERGTFLPPIINLESGENIIHMVVTEEYKGFMLYAYENGKLAKIPLDRFKTRYTKTVKSYNQESKLLRMIQLDKDVDIVLMSSIDKVLLFNTSEVPTKSTKHCAGVGGLKSKNGSKMVSLNLVNEVFNELTQEEIEWYRAKRDAVGKYVKKEHNWTKEQLTL